MVYVCFGSKMRLYIQTQDKGATEFYMNEEIRQLLSMSAEEEKYLNKRFQSASDAEPALVEASAFLRERQLFAVRVNPLAEEVRPHQHEMIEMTYVYQGSVIHEVDGKRVVLEAGDVLLMNQDSVHRIEPRKETDLALIVMARPEFFDVPFQMLQERSEIKNFLINSFRRGKRDAEYLLFHPTHEMEIANLVENLALASIRDDESANAACQYTMGVIFLLLLGKTEGAGAGTAQGYRDILVRETLKYIDAQYKTATLGKIAEEYHQSLSGLSKVIKQETGYNFQELLMRKRFQKATKLLLETNLQVEEIAVSVGYENVSYFYRQFKHRYGMTPRQYRIVHGAGCLRTGCHQ